MRWCLVLMAAALTTSAASATVIWSDGFESAAPLVEQGWSVVGGQWKRVSSALAAHSGTAGLDIQGAAVLDAEVLGRTISTVGYESVSLEYWYKIRDGLEAADHVWIDWSADGNSWQTLVEYTALPAGDWLLASIPLPLAAANNPALGVRLRAQLGGSTDRMNFDDLSIVGVPVPEPSMVALMVLASVCLRRRVG